MSSSNVNSSRSKVNAGDEKSTSDKRDKNDNSNTAATSKKSSSPNLYDSKQKRPSSSLFRIKTGCIVALRFQTEGNTIDVCRSRTLKRKRDDITAPKIQTINLDEDTMQVWVDPIAGRDERYALIGNRIRCFFPQSNDKQTKRTLEGEVICWVDDENLDKSNLPPYKVELLIEKSMLVHFPFLNRIDDEIDVAKLPNEKARKKFLLEESIRGRNKATVHVTLENPGALGTSLSSDRLRWVILKRVPRTQLPKEAKTNTGKRSSNENLIEATKEIGRENDSNIRGIGESGNKGALSSDTLKSQTKLSRQNSSNEKASGSTKQKSSTTTANVRYCGDGNDSTEQQVSNWRWLSSRYPDISYNSTARCFPNTTEEYNWNIDAVLKKTILIGGLMGRVVNVSVSPSKSEDSTLALVTIRRFILPEHTISGRLPNHKQTEVFESFDDIILNGDERDQIEFRIPIEHLIIVKPSPQSIENDSESNLNGFFLQYSYSTINNTYAAISCDEEMAVDEVRKSLSTSPVSSEFCHRCRTSMKDVTSCTNGKNCLLHRSSIGAARWCKSCIRTLTLGTEYYDDHFLNGSKNDEEVDLPCCMGLCECRMCTSDLTLELQRNFHKQVIGTSKASLNYSDYPSPFHYTNTAIEKLSDVTDFCLGSKYIELNSFFSSSTKYISRIRPRKMKKLQKLSLRQGRAKKMTGKGSLKDASNNWTITVPTDKEDYNVFKPTCARVDISNDAIPKGNDKSSDMFPSAKSSMSNSFLWASSPSVVDSWHCVGLCGKSDHGELAMSGKCLMARS